MQEKRNSQVVYLDIISGFLGAGKTTFVNRLLDFYMKSGEKPVYIVNEYGEAGLDSRLMENEGFETYEMTNGCICCTLRGEIVRSIARILDEVGPTRIVFEPSGVFMFDNFFEIMTKPGIEGRCEVGNVITVIDGTNYVSARLEYRNFIYDQIKTAPILFISKLDKAGDPDISEIICDVRNINPESVIFTEGYEGLTDDRMSELFLGKPRKPNCAPFNEEHEEEEHHHGNDHEHHDHDHEHHHHHDHEHDHEHHHAHLHEAFDTVTVRLEREFEQEEITRLVQDISSGRYGEIVRAKGIIKSGGKNILINITFEDAEIKMYPRFAEPSMTFIGPHLDHERIEGLKA